MTKPIDQLFAIHMEAKMKSQKMLGRTLLAFLVTLALLLSGFQPAQAKGDCVAEAQTTLQVLEGLTLTWESSFSCTDMPQEGEFKIEVVVQNSAGSSQSAVIGPLTIEPGESDDFAVIGPYELDESTNEASLPLVVDGKGETSLEAFQLQIEVNLVGEEEDPDDDDLNDDNEGEDGDDPSGGYYCRQSDVEHPFGAYLADKYEVDYTTLQSWFCEESFGWGQIMLALHTARITEDDADLLLDAASLLLEERSNGKGWGEIWQELKLIGRPEDAGPPNDEDGDGKPDFAGPPNDEDGDGKPDFAGPPNDEDGDGKPDFAGPPHGESKGRP
jgi:hypothetical protein